MSVQFPFPDKSASRFLLEQDYCYHKIPESARHTVFELAWSAGVQAAQAFLRDNAAQGPLCFLDLLKAENFVLEYKDEDYIVGDRRYFCELYPKQRRACIYTRSVQIWCEANALMFDEGVNILLAHEYYHHLEWYEIGLTSKLYLVPMLQIGRFQLGKTGIAALSEIGANAFAHTCFAHMQPGAAAIP